MSEENMTAENAKTYAYAVIGSNGVIENTIVWDGETDIGLTGETLRLEDGSPLGIGWKRTNGKWVAPEPPAVLAPES